MNALNDREIARMEFRIGLFRRRGWSLERAERFADVLAARDQDKDDRRACIECAHLQRGFEGVMPCFAASQGWIRGASSRLTPVVDVLQRCPRFEWAKPA